MYPRRRHPRISEWAIALTFAVVALSSACVPALAQSSEMRVGAFPVPPFVMEQNGQLTGFSIELWNGIAAQLKVKSDFHVVPDAAALFKEMRGQQLDVIVSPVFITSARDAEFDFSYPVMESGFGIMILDTGDTKPVSPLGELLHIFFSPSLLVWLGVALLLIVVPAHLIWFFDRRAADDVIASEHYFPGIFQAMAWAASALVSQVQALPGHWLARILGLVWMFGGVVFVAFYTAQLTSTLTVQKIHGSIEGPSDLPGKVVGTIANSTAVATLKAHKADVQEYATTEEMFNALLQKKVDAVVTGAPVLLYYASHQGAGLVKVVGPQFNEAPLSMLFQLGSPWRKKVDTALIVLRENGTYDQLYQKWFGTE